MYNIKQKVYVTTDLPDAEQMYGRNVCLLPDYSDTWVAGEQGTADKFNPNDGGCVFIKSSLDTLVAEEFHGNIGEFLDWLANEHDCLIVVDEPDYVKLFCMMILELQSGFQLSDEQVNLIVDCQYLKDYFYGKYIPTFHEQFNLIKAQYETTGFISDTYAEQNMPFEIVYALYKWDKISRDRMNTKLSIVAEAFFLDYFREQIQAAKITLGGSSDIVTEYLGVAKGSLDNTEDLINAIENEPVLREVFKGEDCNFNLADATIQANVVRLAQLFIDHSLDMDTDPAKDTDELNFFLDIYKLKDIDIINRAKFDFINTGFIAMRLRKFNSLLLMKL